VDTRFTCSAYRHGWGGTALVLCAEASGNLVLKGQLTRKELFKRHVNVFCLRMKGVIFSTLDSKGYQSFVHNLLISYKSLFFCQNMH